MENKTETTNNSAVVEGVIAPVATADTAPTAPVAPTKDGRAPMRRGGASRGGPRGGRGGRGDKERSKPEFDSKIIGIRRVTRVTKGGRRLSFSVTVVAGDKKGRVGVGMGKSIDTSIAIDKATRDAKKHMIKAILSPQMTVPHMVQTKFASAIVMVSPARGRGVVAGSSARTVVELAGVRDVAVKILSGSKNKINIARATIQALTQMSKVNRSVLNKTASSTAK